MKKIIGVFLTIYFLLTATTGVMAESKSNWKIAKATPGNPVTLEGSGDAKAYGRGKVHYQVTNGHVRIVGRGVVAVKGNADIQAQGFGKKKQVGDITYYVGKGEMNINGANYAVSAWLRRTWPWERLSMTSAKGEGKVTYRGYWDIKYHGPNSTDSHMTTVELPSELQADAGEEANLN